MRYWIFIFSFFLLPLFSSAVYAQDDSVIGTVLEVEGTAAISTAGAAAGLPAVVNTPVHLQDTIETGPQSRVMILFIDDTQMILSENTKLTVDEYIFDPEDAANNKGVYSVLAGAFQYVSGLIAKKETPDVTINTPVGTIGIRGTELFGGEVDGEYGVFVDEGIVNLKTDAGEALVRKGEGTSVKGRGFRPGPAKAWAPERLQKARGRVFLQRREEVKKRIADNRLKQPEQRQRYKQFMQQRREKMQQLKAHPEMKQELKEQRREKLEEFRQNQPPQDRPLQERLQEKRRQGMQEGKNKSLPEAESMKNKVRERVQNRRQN